MRWFFTALFWVVGIGSLLGGLQEVGRLRTMQAADGYRPVPGSVLRIERYRASGSGLAERPGPSEERYHVVFAYRDGAQQGTGQQVSPVCGDCSAAELRRLTGRTPQQLQPGTALPVFVAPAQPGEAYLALPDAADIRSQWWSVLLRLVVVPLLAFGASRMDWTKSNNEKSDKAK